MFLFTDTATTEIYTSVHTLSLHDALPISRGRSLFVKATDLSERPRTKFPPPFRRLEIGDVPPLLVDDKRPRVGSGAHQIGALIGWFLPAPSGLVVREIRQDRKSTRLNSSH